MSIIRRREHFSFCDRDDYSAWAGELKIIGLFLDNFSCYLPVGERFFVGSVLAFKSQIQDEILQVEVNDFIFQEAQHQSAHRQWNGQLKKTKASVYFSELTASVLLKLLKTMSSKRFQLAITVATEHFTAIISDWLLRHQKIFLNRTYSEPGKLWLWHAIEETEHKAVAFDLFYHVTPNKFYAYGLRLIAMLLLSIGLGFAMSINLPFLYLGKRRQKKQTKCQHDRVAPQPLKIKKDTNKKTLPKVKTSFKGFYHSFIVPYAQYFKWSFHPDFLNNKDALAKAKNRLAKLSEN